MNRGDIVIVDLPETQNSIQYGKRSCIVIQNDIGNEHSTLTIVVPCTTKQEKPNLPTHFYFFSPKGVKNTVLCEQILTIPKSIITGMIGRLNEKQLKQLDKCLKISIGLGDTK